MGDTREASRPRMSPQWEMVFARFDDLARQVANIEAARIQDGRENRSEFQELRDQIQRTRDEVAQGVASTAASLSAEDHRMVEALEAVGERVEAIERTRKGDVREVIQEAAPEVAAAAIRHAPAKAWALLGWPSKTGAIVTGLTVIGGLIAGVVEGAPKVAGVLWRIIDALGRPSA